MHYSRSLRWFRLVLLCASIAGLVVLGDSHYLVAATLARVVCIAGIVCALYMRDSTCH